MMILSVEQVQLLIDALAVAAIHADDLEWDEATKIEAEDTRMELKRYLIRAKEDMPRRRNEGRYADLDRGPTG